MSMAPWRVGIAMGLTALAAVGCHKEKEKPAPGHKPHADKPKPPTDPELLGREVFELVDQAVDYKGSHRNRAPTTLRLLGLDSLTPTTVRRISITDNVPTLTVAFRKPAGRTVASCQGDPRVLEEASLNEGQFSVYCSGPSGDAHVKVTR